MSTTVRPQPPRQAPRRRTAHRVIGWSLLVCCWVALVIATVVLGHRASTFAQLETDVAAGEATDVRVTGELSPSSTGYGVVQVQWRRGLPGTSPYAVDPGHQVTAIHRTVGSAPHARPGCPADRGRRHGARAPTVG